MEPSTIKKWLNYIFSILVPFIVTNTTVITTAQAHPYQPINEGEEVLSSYIFEVDTTKKEYKQADTKGKVSARTTGWEEINGKKYMKYVVNFHDIPFMQEQVVLWRRKDDTGLYILQKRDDKYNESLELPNDVSLGKSWSYNDGVESTRTVSAVLDLTLPSGEKFRDCIEVTRQIVQVDALKDFSDKSYYCRGKGAVRTVYQQQTPIGTYKTETYRVRPVR